MADQSFRDVSGCTVFTKALSGIESVRLRLQGETVEFSSDDDDYVGDVGLTKQYASVEVSRKSPSKLRDIVSAVFTSQQGDVTGSVTFGRCQSVDIEQSADPIHDSGDDDSWITYIGTTGKKGSARVSARDIAQHRTGVLVQGKKGTLIVSVPVPRTGYGLPASTATETHTVVCMVGDQEISGGHGGLWDGNVSFQMYGATQWTPSPTSATSLCPVSVGSTGTVSFTAPAADAAAAEPVSVAGAVMLSRSVQLRHGEHSRATYRFEAPGSDGSTSPVT